jgi:DNA-directed RNA polymerase specialized sigma subunit
MKDCAIKCMDNATPCENKECRQWINFSKEQNCTLISIYINGPMTLRQISERMGISFARVKQIELRALKKLNNYVKQKNLTF